MFYNLEEIIYVNKVFYIKCPYCDSYIDICGKEIWDDVTYTCDDCLNYYTIKLGIEVTKCES